MGKNAPPSVARPFARQPPKKYHKNREAVLLDTVSARRRSQIMSRVRGKNTAPELAIRRLVHAMGFRYRLHRRDITGTPDLAFIKARKVIFVHGCFWHRHPGCPNTRTPKSNVGFWRAKLAANRRRDRANLSRLAASGWRVLVLWECEISNLNMVRFKVASFLKRGEGGKNAVGGTVRGSRRVSSRTIKSRI
jgi:DNA mismatch endonuclease (patch repair protein)